MKYWKSKLLFFCCLFSLSIVETQAQSNPIKKGKPSLDEYENDEKSAKNGYTKSMLTMGRACMGGMYTPDEAKDYSKAIKWFEMAMKTPAKAGEKGELEAFAIYLMGGYGEEPNLMEAQRVLTDLCAVKKSILLTKTYADNEDLDLCKLIELQKTASKPEDYVRLGRYFVEFDLSTHFANVYFDKANTPDALYLKEKMRLNRHLAYLEVEKAAYENKLIELQRDFAQQGSKVAALEYVYLSKMMGLDAKKLLDIVLENASPEMEVKALALLVESQFGKDKIIAMRQLEEACKKHQISYPFTDKIVEEYNQVRKELVTLEGLAAVAKQYHIKEVSFDYSFYQRGFNNNISALADLYENLDKESKWIGEINVKYYRVEIDKKIIAIMKKSTTIPELVEIWGKILDPAHSHFIQNTQAIDFELKNHGIALIKSIRNVEDVENAYKYIRAAKETLGTKNYQFFHELVKDNIRSILDAVFDIGYISILRMKFESSFLLKEAYPDYKTHFERLIKASGATPADILYYNWKSQIEDGTFASIAQAKVIYNTVDSSKTISPEQKKELHSSLKNKALLDLYGENVSLQMLNALKAGFTGNEKWLLPEGMTFYSERLSESISQEVLKTHFRSVQEGKPLYDKIAANKDLQEKERTILLAETVDKVLSDVYGQNPSEEQIQQLKGLLLTQKWLLPQGNEEYSWYYVNDQKRKLKKMRFNTYSEGLSVHIKVNSDNSLAPDAKTELLKTIRIKTIEDVLGNKPTPDLLSELIAYVEDSEGKWLKDDAAQVIMDMTSNNEAYFRKKVTDAYGNVISEYVVRKEPEIEMERESLFRFVKSIGAEEGYELQIFEISNGMHQKVYHTYITVKEENNENYTVYIHLKENLGGYSWNASKTDYFKATVFAHSEEIKVEAVGKMRNYHSEKEDFNYKQLKMRKAGIKPTPKVAIDACLPYFIVAYHSLMMQK